MRKNRKRQIIRRHQDSNNFAFCDTVTCAISALAFALVSWIILTNLYKEPSNKEAIPLFCLLLIAILLIAFFPKEHIKQIIVWLSAKRGLCLALAVAIFAIGFVLRFEFLVFDYAPTSDPAQFFNNATSLARDNKLANASYIAMYPYLFAYDWLLSLSFRLIPGLCGTIIINTAYDIASTILFGHIIESITNSQKSALIAAIVWWVNPMNIIFCAISLPIIVVNTLILSVFNLMFALFQNIEKTKVLIWLSLGSGLALGILDAFRPIAAIFVIATTLYLIIYFLKNKRLMVIRNCIISLAIITISFSIVGFGYQQLVNSYTNLPANGNKSGWSIFVGSNYDTSGGWSRSDSDYMEKLLKNNSGDVTATFAQLQERGIARWRKLGFLKGSELLFKKSVRLCGDIQNMIYNLSGSFSYWQKHAKGFSVLHILCAIYWFVTLALSAGLLWQRRKNGHLDFQTYLCIAMFGMFLASMLVEVANRYFTIFFPIMSTFAVLMLRQMLKNNKPVSNC